MKAKVNEIGYELYNIDEWKRKYKMKLINMKEEEEE